MRRRGSLFYTPGVDHNKGCMNLGHSNWNICNPQNLISTSTFPEFPKSKCNISFSCMHTHSVKDKRFPHNRRRRKQTDADDATLCRFGSIGLVDAAAVRFGGCNDDGRRHRHLLGCKARRCPYLGFGWVQFSFSLN